MKNKLLFLIIIMQIMTLSFFKPKNNEIKNYKHSINVFKSSNLNDEKLESYIIGVVAAEMPASFSLEALKAQAVAARTFAYNKLQNGELNYDSLIYDKGQAYITLEEMRKKWNSDFYQNYEKIIEAVLSTRGEIVLYNNNPINAYYFSMTNGKTEESKNVFGEKPYLVSVDSSWDKNVAGNKNESIIPIDKFKTVFGINNDEPIMISDLSINETNHVNSLKINGKTYSGIDVRKKLNLRSTDFKIDINNDNVHIKTSGYGHGVGMSQHGANYLANSGKNYKEILSYYYLNTTIGKI